MVNEKKIRLMTRAAMLEEKDGRGIFVSKKFQYKDFVIFQVTKSVVVITIGYALFLLILMLLNMENLADDSSVTTLLIIIGISSVIYLVLLAVTILLTIHSCREAFEFSNDVLKEYRYIVRKLKKADEGVEKVFVREK